MVPRLGREEDEALVTLRLRGLEEDDDEADIGAEGEEDDISAGARGESLVEGEDTGDSIEED